MKYQEEIMRRLPSRSALNELVDWLRLRLELVESLSEQIGVEKSNSVNQLEAYKRKLTEINDEMKQGQENSLKFIRNSIEDEIQQGFYDLSVSEQLAKTERDWTRLKHKLNTDLERLNLSLVRISEFDRNVKQMQLWIQNQSIGNNSNEVSSILNQSTSEQIGSGSIVVDLNVIDDDKKILAQINNYKELLSRLENLWQQERNELPSSENCKIGLLVQYHMSKNLDELKSNLQRMELISKLKIENNLTQIKQNYTMEINELNAALESEVNFINFGKNIQLKKNLLFFNFICFVNLTTKLIQINKFELTCCILIIYFIVVSKTMFIIIIIIIIL